MGSKAEPRLVLPTDRDATFVPKLEAFVYQVEAVEAVKSLGYAAIFHERAGKDENRR